MPRNQGSTMEEYVSVHGGHSGQFCLHAADSLEDIIRQYIALGFSWVGITEHMPPVDDTFRYPDEVKEGLSAEKLLGRFLDYTAECRRLKEKYAPRITLLLGLETETCPGYFPFVSKLINQCRPDYIVGSVHHVNGLCFDFSRAHYERAAAAAGGISAMYCHYFDLQHEMINLLEPAVVGHFDLIRLFDPHYKTRIQQREIQDRIARNLALISRKNLVMDFNLRALLKGADEPYISKPILRQAKVLDIPVVPGDDSHGVDNIGQNMEKGIGILKHHGFDTCWQRPRCYKW